MFYIDLYVFKGAECNGEQYDAFKAIIAIVGGFCSNFKDFF